MSVAEALWCFGLDLNYSKNTENVINVDLNVFLSGKY